LAVYSTPLTEIVIQGSIVSNRTGFQCEVRTIEIYSSAQLVALVTGECAILEFPAGIAEIGATAILESMILHYYRIEYSYFSGCFARKTTAILAAVVCDDAMVQGDRRSLINTDSATATR